MFFLVPRHALSEVTQGKAQKDPRLYLIKLLGDQSEMEVSVPDVSEATAADTVSIRAD